MLRSILLGQHFARTRLVLHGPGDRQLGRIVVVLVDQLVIGGIPVDEHAADDAEVLGLILRNDPFFDAVGNCLGDAVLRGSEHLDRLLGTFDADLGDHDGDRFHSEIRCEHSQQI